MRGFSPVLAFSVLVLTAPVVPALGDETGPARTPWKATDPNAENVVRWVVEGCAAYPVTEDAAPERSAAVTHSQTPVDLAAKMKRPISDK